MENAWSPGWTASYQPPNTTAEFATSMKTSFFFLFFYSVLCVDYIQIGLKSFFFVRLSFRSVYSRYQSAITCSTFSFGPQLHLHSWNSEHRDALKTQTPKHRKLQVEVCSLCWCFKKKFSSCCSLKLNFIITITLYVYFFSIVTQVQVDLFKDIKFWKQFRQMCPQGKQNKWYFLFFLFFRSVIHYHCFLGSSFVKKEKQTAHFLLLLLFVLLWGVA